MHAQKERRFHATHQPPQKQERRKRTSILLLLTLHHQLFVQLLKHFSLFGVTVCDNHFFHALDLHAGQDRALTEPPLPFWCLLGQNMALVSPIPPDFTRARDLEALGGASTGLHLRHGSTTPRSPVTPPPRHLL